MKIKKRGRPGEIARPPAARKDAIGLLQQFLDLILQIGDLAVATDDLAILADEEDRRQDLNAVVGGHLAFQTAILMEMRARSRRTAQMLTCFLRAVIEVHAYQIE